MEKYRLNLVSGPSQEPLSLGETKGFLRVDIDDDDAEITLIIQDARERAERVTARQLVTATWSLHLDAFPDVIHLPRSPAQSVSSITYVDTTGTTQTLAADQYDVDAVSEPGRITPSYGNSWPSTRSQINAIAVTYSAGYGIPSDVPAGLRQRMLAAVAHCYEHRAGGIDEDWLDSLFVPWWTGEYA